MSNLTASDCLKKFIIGIKLNRVVQIFCGVEVKGTIFVEFAYKTRIPRDSIR